jgi:uncharacterized protein
MDAIALLVTLGIVAGALTTIAGNGGGLLLLLGLALIWDPARALACTAPALLIGNLHRLWLFRDALDRARLRMFALGALPGSIAGALLAVAIDSRAIHALLAASTGLALLRALLRFEWRLPIPALAPAGAVIGGLMGTSGGSGLLVAPLLLSSGLYGAAYVATTAGCAVTMHAGRIAGYAAGGLFSLELVALSAIATLAIVSGNLLGVRLRRSLECLPESAPEHAVLALCALLALLGVVA